MQWDILATILLTATIQSLFGVGVLLDHDVESFRWYMPLAAGLQVEQLLRLLRLLLRLRFLRFLLHHLDFRN